jgi:hypothetical protein
MKIEYKTAQCFVDSANNKHESKLDYLLAERNYAMRGIVNSDDNGKQTAFTPNQVVQMMLNNSSKIADVVKTFDKAIKKEREKGQAAAV